MLRSYSVRLIYLCDNALLTKPSRIGRAVALPIENNALQDTTTWLTQFCSKWDLPIVSTAEVTALLQQQANRFSPTFALYFDTIDIDYTEESLTEFYLSELKSVLGIIALNRGAYPRPRAMISYKRENGMSQMNLTICDSYYRGNLMGGFISGEHDEALTQMFEQASQNAFISELLDKYRLALLEEDLDLGYFRFWALLETIVAHFQGSYQMAQIRQFVHSLAERKNHLALKEYQVAEEKFDQTQLISIWYAARNLTAHYGGYRLAVLKGISVHGDLQRLISAIKTQDHHYLMGVDTVFLLLRDVVEEGIKMIIRESRARG